MFLKTGLVFLVLIANAYAIFGARSLKCDSSKLGAEHCLKQNKPMKWSGILKNFELFVDPIINQNVRELQKTFKRIDLGNECRDSLLYTGMALRNFEGWAFAMLDATGKLPSGLLDGTVMDFGSYDGCLKIRALSNDKKEAFRGRYCLVGYKSPLFAPMTELTPSGEKYVDAYGYPPEWIADAIIRAGPYLRKVAFWFGTCVPSTCSEDDIRKIATYVAKPLGFNVSVAGCDVEEPHSWPMSALISVSILCLLGLLCTFGTLMDAVLRYSSENEPCPTTGVMLYILKSFSLISNTEKLIKSSNNVGKLGCFHGLRFVSATWIILGHTYFYTDTWKYLRYRNLMGINDKFSGYLPAAVLENFTIPVASFFFMSGFLLVFSTLGKLEKSGGKLNIASFIFHKFWRMTPALGMMIVMLFTLPLVNSGPLWNSTLGPLVGSCQNKWWANILYINNWWDCDQYCLIHTWYLATLMQCHIVGVVILIVSYRWPKIGFPLGFIISIGCSIITALQAVYYDFPMPAPATMRDIDMFVDYTSKIYGKPFCHMASYMIGMGIAYLVMKYREPKIKKRYVILGWISAVIGAVMSVYGLYAPVDYEGFVAFYIAAHRIAWTLSVGWLAFACLSGYGGIVNSILSWNAFIPLGHMSYFAYLLHPLVMLYKNASLRERVFYGHTELVFEFFSYWVISFLIAFIGYIAVEIPFSSIEKLLFKSNASINISKMKEAKEDASVKSTSIKKVKE